MTSLAREVHENFQTTRCEAIQNSRDTTKTKVLVFVHFVSFVNALFMECYASRGFPRYTFKRYLAFVKEAEHLDPYNAKFKESNLQTLTFSLEYVPQGYQRFARKKNWGNCKVVLFKD